MRRYDDYRISTDNVFRDLELLDAEVLNVEAGLAIELGQLIRRRRLNPNGCGSRNRSAPCFCPAARASRKVLGREAF